MRTPATRVRLSASARFASASSRSAPEQITFPNGLLPDEVPGPAQDLEGRARNRAREVPSVEDRDEWIVVADTETGKIVGEIPDTNGVHGFAIASDELIRLYLCVSQVRLVTDRRASAES